MSQDKIEQIIQGFNYTKNILNSITMSGIDNFQKLSVVYNNIDVFLTMLANEEITIIDNTASKEKDIVSTKGGK